MEMARISIAVILFILVLAQPTDSVPSDYLVAEKVYVKVRNASIL
jgi:hypothetical protein